MCAQDKPLCPAITSMEVNPPLPAPMWFNGDPPPTAPLGNTFAVPHGVRSPTPPLTPAGAGGVAPLPEPMAPMAQPAQAKRSSFNDPSETISWLITLKTCPSKTFRCPPFLLLCDPHPMHVQAVIDRIPVNSFKSMFFSKYFKVRLFSESVDISVHTKTSCKCSNQCRGGHPWPESVSAMGP